MKTKKMKRPLWYWSEHWTQFASIATVLGLVLAFWALFHSGNNDSVPIVDGVVGVVDGGTPTSATTSAFEARVRDVAGTWVLDRSEPFGPGEPVEVRIKFQNPDIDNVYNVTIWAEIDSRLAYFDGSTRIRNHNLPEGKWTINQVTTGVNVGAYKPGSIAFVTFVVEPRLDNGDLVCGRNTFVIRAFATTDQWDRKPIETDVIVPVAPVDRNCPTGS